MSRIGRRPVRIPKGVTVTVSDGAVAVKGPKGELSIQVRPEIGVVVEDDTVVVTPRGRVTDQVSAFHGLTRSLIHNMVAGVHEGYERKLEIHGVGYEVEQKGSDLVFRLGFANEIHYPVPPTVTVELPSRTSVVVRGCDKQQVGAVASEIRKIRPPEPYKGKGIKYADEIIRRKAGKAFGSA